jgi:hypothetical protein
MDGGAMVLNNKGFPETVWNRKGTVYACTPGKEEKVLGQGMNCNLETIDNQNIYAWVEKGNVIILKPDGSRESIGKGHLPQLKAVDNDKILCVWENNDQIFKKLLYL